MTSYGVALLATLAVTKNVYGTGWDWPRNKFSLLSGARGHQKHTRLPKIKDWDHYPPRKHQHQEKTQKNATRDLCAGETLISTGRNKGQKCKTRTLRSSNIVLANPNHQKSSAANTDRETFEKEQHWDRPRENSKNINIIQRIPCHTTYKHIYETVWHEQALPNGCTKEHKKCLEMRLPSTSNIQRCQSLLIAHHKYLPTSYKNKGCQTMALIKIPGCNKTKGAVRKGDIIIIIIVVRKRKSEQEKKGCWYQK